MPSLRDFGISTDANARDFYKPSTNKPDAIRILKKDDHPGTFETRDGREVRVLARFLVERLDKDDPTTYTWDVTSMKLMARLAALEDVSSWFTLLRRGTGKLTTYVVEPVEEPPVEAPAPMPKKKSK